MYFYSDNTVLTVFGLDHKHDNILDSYILPPSSSALEKKQQPLKENKNLGKIIFRFIDLSSIINSYIRV